jgi:hypothetical protein
MEKYERVQKCLDIIKDINENWREKDGGLTWAAGDALGHGWRIVELIAGNHRADLFRYLTGCDEDSVTNETEKEKLLWDCRFGHSTGAESDLTDIALDHYYSLVNQGL